MSLSLTCGIAGRRYMLSNDATQRLITELIRAANGAGKLSPLEQANLLRRSTAVVRKYRVMLWRRGIKADATDIRKDPTRDWDEMAGMIQLFAAEDVADEFLEAVSVIKAYRTLLKQARQ